MGPGAAQRIRQRAQRVRNLVKAVVYTLLLVNFGAYFAGDWFAAQLKLDAHSSLNDWATVYATTLNEIAWFVLLLLFELETYWLSDRLSRPARWLVHGSRGLCYAILVQTIVAYSLNLGELRAATLLTGLSDLCALADRGEYLRVVGDYLMITSQNCVALGGGAAFYRIGGHNVVIDRAGLDTALWLTRVDVFEASVWLAIFLLIEETVWIQRLGRLSSPLLRCADLLKPLLYGALLAVAGLWAFVGDWLSAWDELLWIGGFAAIEMNLSASRDERPGSAGAPIR